MSSARVKNYLGAAWRPLFVLAFLSGCGGEPFAGHAVSSDAAPETAPSEPPPDAGVDVGQDAASSPETGPDAAPGNDVHTEPDAGDVAEAAACTSLGDYGPPSSCECFFAGTCPIVDGKYSPDCLWVKTPTTVTGQPTCRGCGRIAFKKNTCSACRETFTCACLGPYLDPGQRCCDGPGGPYLSDYPCD
jgi:hypothetical protein